MRRRPAHFPLLLPLTAAALVTVNTDALAADNLGAIRLDAQPSLIKADGRSLTVISAQVFDERGNIAADGTRVRFTTTAGRLDAPEAVTRNGVARVTLTAADQPGTATIIAVLDTPGRAVPARITVVFSKEAEATDSKTAYVRIDGTQYIGYAAEKGIVQANGKNGGASIRFRNIAVQADVLQFNVRTNAVLALGNVRLSVAGREQRYDHLILNLLQGNGTAERIADAHVDAFELTGLRFDPVPYPKGRQLPLGTTWNLTDLSDASIMVVSRAMLMDPGKRLQFRRATFFVDGNKVFSTPLHVMGLNQDSIFPEQVVGYTQDGFMVDFPFYYQADPSGIGTLNIRRAARVSSSAYSVRPGWSLDLTQNYSGARNAGGTVEVNGLSRQDWGMRFRHAQNLGKDTTGNLFIDFPNHRSLFLNSQASRTYKTFSLNTTISGSRSPGFRDVVTGASSPASGELRQQVYAESFARPVSFLKQVHYAINANAGQQNLFGQAEIPGQPKPPRNLFSQGVGSRFFTDALPVARATTVRQSVSVGRAWIQGSKTPGYGNSGFTLLGTTTLARKFGNLGSAEVNYDYTQTPLASGVNAALISGKHRLGMSGFLGGPEWELSFTGSHSLDSPQSSISGTMQFRIAGPWRGRVIGSVSRFGILTYQEYEYALIRRVGSRDFALYYSTTSRRFQLDLTGARF
ncbi:MAG: Ig-like domain-containing protein [Capsulimonadales bacterium]|nr:Ig-like domain-containing protein [Capsulimonadales bacterium]